MRPNTSPDGAELTNESPGMSAAPGIAPELTRVLKAENGHKNGERKNDGAETGGGSGGKAGETRPRRRERQSRRPASPSRESRGSPVEPPGPAEESGEGRRARRDARAAEESRTRWKRRKNRPHVARSGRGRRSRLNRPPLFRTSHSPTRFSELDASGETEELPAGHARRVTTRFFYLTRVKPRRCKRSTRNSRK